MSFNRILKRKTESEYKQNLKKYLKKKLSDVEDFGLETVKEYSIRGKLNEKRTISRHMQGEF